MAFARSAPRKAWPQDRRRVRPVCVAMTVALAPWEERRTTAWVSSSVEGGAALARCAGWNRASAAMRRSLGVRIGRSRWLCIGSTRADGFVWPPVSASAVGTLRAATDRERSTASPLPIGRGSEGYGPRSQKLAAKRLLGKRRNICARLLWRRGRHDHGVQEREQQLNGGSHTVRR